MSRFIVSFLQRSSVSSGVSINNTASKSSYHHGDLRETLLQAAHQLLKEQGVEGVSLRKLAERVGVSRTAPYHHFKDKNELLCGIAERGFRDWMEKAVEIFEDHSLDLRERYARFFHGYVIYAAENPELYDLMFGRTIWKTRDSTQALKDVAYPCFQYQVEMTRHWQANGMLPVDQDPLRLAQVTWGTMHGIARLIIDGIYADTSHVSEMIDCAVTLFLRE